MTTEYATLVLIPRATWEESFADLARQAERALARYEKAAPGDRREALRYEAICRHLEKTARRIAEAGGVQIRLNNDDVLRLDAGAPPERHPWSLKPYELFAGLGAAAQQMKQVAADGVVFELRGAFSQGTDMRIVQPLDSVAAARPPASPWRASDGVQGLRAVEERWRGQLAVAAGGGSEPLVPSGVSNRVLTEGLREFVQWRPGRQRIEARVVYRDGSESRRFPFGALKLTDDPDDGRPVLRVALMSMRHPEMDTAVDAAWLRNRLVSQVRPSAETDELVYETSRSQLADLATCGTVCLHMYQTGFEPAVVGFYRALTDHLLTQPKSVTLVPFFYRKRNGSYQEGIPWATCR